MIKNSIPRLQDALSLIDGNIKYAFYMVNLLFNLGMSCLSLGDTKMCIHYFDRMLKVKYDSEALEDQKAEAFQ